MIQKTGAAEVVNVYTAEYNVTCAKCKHDYNADSPTCPYCGTDNPAVKGSFDTINND